MRIGVVVADAGRARIFSTPRLGSTLKSRKDLINPLSKQKEQELTSDRSGHTISPSGTGHTMSNKAIFKEREAHQFAKGIINELEETHQIDHFDKLFLVAAPRFLGHLRQEMSQELQQLVTGELAKDFSLMTEQEIQKHLYEATRLH